MWVDVLIKHLPDLMGKLNQNQRKQKKKYLKNLVTVAHTNRARGNGPSAAIQDEPEPGGRASNARADADDIQPPGDAAQEVLPLASDDELKDLNKRLLDAFGGKEPLLYKSWLLLRFYLSNFIGVRFEEWPASTLESFAALNGMKALCVFVGATAANGATFLDLARVELREPADDSNAELHVELQTLVKVIELNKPLSDKLPSKVSSPRDPLAHDSSGSPWAYWNIDGESLLIQQVDHGMLSWVVPLVYRHELVSNDWGRSAGNIG